MTFIERNENIAEQKIINIWEEYLKNKSSEDYTTIFIMVPFCSQKCNYCQYSSKVVKFVPDLYIDNLERQFQKNSKIFKNEPIKAIAFGGGTPNMLSPKQLERIFNITKKYWNIEVTKKNERSFEINPYHLTDEHIDVLKNSFINRISMGIQTFNENVLNNEHRTIYSKDKIKNIYETIKSFAVVNTDLLVGLIGQNSTILLDDVKTLLDAGINQLTIYGLNRFNKRNNIESQPENIYKMILDVYKVYAKNSNYSNYSYYGTNETTYCECNTFKNSMGFQYPYSTVPLGYNNCVSFTLYDDILFGNQYPYSYFTILNKGYERTNIIQNKMEKLVTSFYNITDRLDRTYWHSAVRNRQ